MLSSWYDGGRARGTAAAAFARNKSVKSSGGRYISVRRSLMPSIWHWQGDSESLQRPQTLRPLATRHVLEVSKFARCAAGQASSWLAERRRARQALPGVVTISEVSCIHVATLRPTTAAIQRSSEIHISTRTNTCLIWPQFQVLCMYYRGSGGTKNALQLTGI